MAADCIIDGVLAMVDAFKTAREKRAYDAYERSLGLIPENEGVIPLSSKSALMAYAQSASKSISRIGGVLQFELNGITFVDASDDSLVIERSANGFVGSNTRFVY